MKPPIFDYIAAANIDAAVAALADAGGEAKILAGGQSLVPMLNFRLLRPALLVDINRIPGLTYIEESADRIRVGALRVTTSSKPQPLLPGICRCWLAQ